MTEYKSAEDYLEAILIVKERDGRCRSVDVAKQLGFSKPSVSVAISKLERAGLVKKEEDGELRLTEAGSLLAGEVLEKHQFLTKLLTGLGVPAEIAEQDACAMEHSLSEESFSALKKLIRD